MEAPTRAELVAHAHTGTLLSAIFSEYGRHYIQPGDPTVAMLAELHNAGEIDVLSIATPEAIAALPTAHYFHGVQVYRALIRHLRASAADLLTLAQLLIDAAGQDMTANFPVEDFAAWCGLDASRPAELLALVDAHYPNADRFLTIAIKYGALVDRETFLDRGYAFLTSPSDTEKQNAIYALGQVALNDDTEWQRWRLAYAAMLDAAPSDATQAVMLSALQHRLNGAPAEENDRLAQLGIRLLAGRGDHLLHQASHTLGLYPAGLPAPLVEALFATLENVKGDNKATLELIDYALAGAVERGEADRARSFVATLVRRDEDAIDGSVFDSLWHKVVETGGETLDDWLVSWLLDGDYRLIKRLDGSLFNGGGDDPSLAVDFGRYGLRARDFTYVARKAIGGFFLKPDLMASLLVSLMRAAPDSEIDALVALLVDPVLLNYSGVADGYLAAVGEDDADKAQAPVKTALARRQTYLDGLQAIGRVPELRPSERERAIEGQRHADAMQEAWEQARGRSAFAGIVSESLLLYGTRSVSYVSDPAQPPRRIETALGSISHSFEVPRIDIVDPIGLQSMLLTYRGERRPE